MRKFLIINNHFIREGAPNVAHFYLKTLKKTIS